MKTKRYHRLLLTGLLSSFCIACTPLDRIGVKQTPPAAHLIEKTHDSGPGRPQDPPVAELQKWLDLASSKPNDHWTGAPPLSPGDRIRIDVQDDESLSGRYEINIDGTLNLPYLSPIAVAGVSVEQAQERIREALIKAELLRKNLARVSLRVHEWSNVQVHVSGAVFAPGMLSVNVRKPEERALKGELIAGDSPPERLLSAALRSAGGVRPDADLSAILLIRNNRPMRLDYRSMIRGGTVRQLSLMSGDRVIVPSTGTFDRDLVMPSAITPPGIRVFLSNLTTPAKGNAPSAIGQQSTSLPYGSRLMTGAVSANCVGGIQSTNASRYLVLVRTDPISGREEVIERAIHALLQAPDRDDLNPFLMPNDSIACYDSGVTNLRDVAKTLYELLLPFTLFL